MLSLIIMLRLFAMLLVTALMPAFVTSAGDEITASTIMTAHDLDETALAAALVETSAATRRAALFRITEARRTDFETAARVALADPTWSVRRMATRALESIGTEASRVALKETARGRDSQPVRARAVMALTALADSRSLPLFMALLDDEDFAVRGTAAKMIGVFGDTRPLDRLHRLASNDPFVYVRVRAVESIDRLSPPATPLPTAAPTNKPGGTARLSPLLLGGGLLLLLAIIVFFQRRDLRIAVIRVFAGAALVVAITALFVARPWAAQPPAPVLLLLDPPLANHPLILAAGGPEVFLEALAAGVRSSGLEMTPQWRIGASPALAAAHEPLRNQYDMDSALAGLAKEATGVTTVVITGAHLFVEPFYTVLGRATRRGGVISTRWIDPVFLGEERIGDAEAALFRDQLIKVLVHELGHACGLSHCEKNGCVMRSIEEAAEELHRLDAVLCPDCRSAIHAQP